MINSVNFILSNEMAKTHILFKYQAQTILFSNRTRKFNFLDVQNYCIEDILFPVLRKVYSRSNTEYAISQVRGNFFSGRIYGYILSENLINLKFFFHFKVGEEKECPPTAYILCGFWNLEEKKFVQEPIFVKSSDWFYLMGSYEFQILTRWNQRLKKYESFNTQHKLREEGNTRQFLMGDIGPMHFYQTKTNNDSEVLDVKTKIQGEDYSFKCRLGKYENIYSTEEYNTRVEKYKCYLIDQEHIYIVSIPYDDTNLPNKITAKSIDIFNIDTGEVTKASDRIVQNYYIIRPRPYSANLYKIDFRQYLYKLVQVSVDAQKEAFFDSLPKNGKIKVKEIKSNTGKLEKLEEIFLKMVRLLIKVRYYSVDFVEQLEVANLFKLCKVDQSVFNEC